MQLYALRQPLHVSWHIAWLSIGVVTGVIAAQFVGQDGFSSTSWLLCAGVLISLVMWKRYAAFLLLSLIAGCLIGLWRGSIEQAALAAYRPLYQQEVALHGTVAEDVELNRQGQLVMRLHDLSIHEVHLPGAVWASVATKLAIKRGDRVAIAGRLTPGFGSFTATMYQAKITAAVRPEPGDVARRARDAFAANVRQAIGEPEASLGVGFLVGQRRGLPEDLEQALKVAGLTHIVVASGYNLTILVRLTRRLFERVSKYLSALSAGGMIVSFMAVTGLSPSMSRAGLVAGLSLLAWYYGRKFHPLVLLSFAAAVTLLINPSYGWNDLGWQLSFAAFAGVMIVAPLAQAYFFGDKKPGMIRQILGETVAAQLATLPILVLAFGTFSNIAVIANLLVLPLVPLAMILTFIAGFAASIVPASAALVGLPADWLLSYMTSVASFLADQSWAVTELSIGWWQVGLFYGGLIAVCLYMAKQTRYQLRDANLVA